MASYHYVYFNVRGRGESSRILLALTKVAHTEQRVTFPEWPDLKASQRCPFSQLPILELGNGRTLSQSATILKFLACEHGVAPSDPYERARASMIVDSVKDMEDKMGLMLWEKDEARKETLKTAIFEEHLPKLTENLNKILQANSGGNGYLVGNKISHADINVFSFFNGFIGGGVLEVPDELKEFPLLVDLYNKVMNEPNILEYLKQRKPNPDTYPY